MFIALTISALIEVTSGAYLNITAVAFSVGVTVALFSKTTLSIFISVLLSSKLSPYGYSNAYLFSSDGSNGVTTYSLLPILTVFTL